MAFSEVLSPLPPQINRNPPSAKIFKTMPILKIYAHPLFPKLFYLPPHPGPKLFNLPHLTRSKLIWIWLFKFKAYVFYFSYFAIRKHFKNFEKCFFHSIYSTLCRFFPSLSSFQIQRVKPKKNFCKHVLQLKETSNWFQAFLVFKILSIKNDCAKEKIKLPFHGLF